MYYRKLRGLTTGNVKSSKKLIHRKMTFFDCTRFQLKNKKKKIQTHPPVFEVIRPNKPLVFALFERPDVSVKCQISLHSKWNECIFPKHEQQEAARHKSRFTAGFTSIFGFWIAGFRKFVA
jgi:hypothetical protein